MPFRSALLLGLLGVSDASITDLCANHTEVTIETLVFSGTPNPIIKLQGSEWHELCAALQGVANVELPTCRVLGFTGFKLCPTKSLPQEECTMVRGNPNADLPILASVLKRVPDMSPATTDHITEELSRLHQSNGGDAQCAHDVSPPVPNGQCNGPVVGPDDPNKVHYDVRNDDEGCFLTKQRDNNCYDYGTDIATNTFAQPGRGSRKCAPHARPCVKNTCDDIKNAAISDGLEWVGTELPTELPTTGHYVSLHIWPNSNFHWIRMDADKTWSHKPGGSQVRNVDNNHKKITDPGQSDFSPWTQHCGYMMVVPSKGKINADIKATVVV